MRKFHPYLVYMDAADEGNDLSGMDRGDDIDPSLFEDEGDNDKNDDAARGPTEEASEDEKAGEKADDKSDDKPEADDKSDDQEVDDKKPDEKPKKESRANKRIQQLTEKTAALERQLAERVGNQQLASDLAELEAESGRLQKDYMKALREDEDKAAELLHQMRAVDRKIAKLEASAEAEAAVTARMEARDLAATITEIVADYPELDQGDEAYDQDLVDEINAVFTGLIPKSTSKSAAMRKAVKYVMGANTKAAPAALGEESKDAPVRQARREEGSSKAAKAVAAQPAKSDEAGRASDSRGRPTVRTISDLDKMSEKELAKLRGDDI